MLFWVEERVERNLIELCLENEEMSQVKHAEVVESENDNGNAFEDSVLNDDDQKSYTAAVFNIRLYFLRNLRSSMIAGKYFEKLQNPLEGAAVTLQRLQLEVEDFKDVQVDIECAEVLPGSPAQGGSTGGSLRGWCHCRSQSLSPPYSVWGLLRRLLALVWWTSTGAGPASAGYELSRSEYALLIYPKKNGLSAVSLSKKNLYPVSLNLGAVSRRPIRSDGVVAELVSRETVEALKLLLTVTRDLFTAHPPVHFRTWVRVFEVDSAV